MLADILSKGGVDPQHKGRDGFTGVVGRPIASQVHLELHSSRRRGTRTLGQELLNGVVVLLSMVVVRGSFVGGVVQGHMFPTDVRITGTEVIFMSLTELS